MNKGEVSLMNEIKEKRKVYSFEEALSASTVYFKGDEMAAKVWVSKYALKDSYGNIFECSPDDMHRRLAKEIARIETKYANPMSEEDIFNLLKE
ncbi:MAG: ribonucleotide reductase N-terminal alpha domain-containing protein, partial [Bacteroidales bacterium]|nr:ribonucleotide reductase N-terminal alpha domain-containing protein [Bacteroidales bacterium]